MDQARLNTIYAFIEKCCIEQNIDESHGLKHAKSCIEWVNKLVDGCQEPISEDEYIIAIYSVALHDMCDHKYTNVEVATEALRQWLETQIYFVEICINIISTISYSKLKKQVVNGIPVYPDHGKWQRAYHIVRHADLLDAYDVRRCYLYTQHSQPQISEENCWSVVRELFDNRIFKYVSDGFIFLPAALAFVPALEEEAHRCFNTRAFA